MLNRKLVAITIENSFENNSKARNIQDKSCVVILFSLQKNDFLITLFGIAQINPQNSCGDASFGEEKAL